MDLPVRTWQFLALSALATGASWICYIRALQIGYASKLAPVDKLSLVLVAIFAFAFLDERPILRDWTGIVMVAGGVQVLSLKRLGIYLPTLPEFWIPPLSETEFNLHRACAKFCVFKNVWNGYHFWRLSYSCERRFSKYLLILLSPM